MFKGDGPFVGSAPKKALAATVRSGNRRYKMHVVSDVTVKVGAPARAFRQALRGRSVATDMGELDKQDLDRWITRDGGISQQDIEWLRGLTPGERCAELRGWLDQDGVEALDRFLLDLCGIDLR